MLDFVSKTLITNFTIAGSAQPAIVTTSLADYEVYKKEHGEPGHISGHSLGEWTAAGASGVIELPDLFTLVKLRGTQMGQVSGSMVASLGLPVSTVRKICEEAKVFIANINSEKQIIISGEMENVPKAMKLIAGQNGRTIPLPINVPSHSPLMAAVQEKIHDAFEGISLKPPRIPFASNVNAKYAETAATVRKNLEDQITQTVQWLQLIRYLVSKGANSFVEIGPGRALTGIIKKIDKNVDVKNFNDLH